MEYMCHKNIIRIYIVINNNKYTYTYRYITLKDGGNYAYYIVIYVDTLACS